tara:strand:- start:244 stop:942 length:699 start_codon:yes stop_codon:yes gene_type:complete
MVTGLRQRPLTPDLLLIVIHPSPPSLNKKSKTFSRYSSLADRNADPVNLTAGLAPPARFPNDEPDRACGTEPDLKEFPRGGLPAFPFIERALPALGAYEYIATGGDVADAGIGELGDVPFSKSPDFLSGLSEDCGESVYDGESPTPYLAPPSPTPSSACIGVFINTCVGEEVSGTNLRNGPGDPAHSLTTSKSAIVIAGADAAFNGSSTDGPSSNKSSGRCFTKSSSRVGAL